MSGRGRSMDADASVDKESAKAKKAAESLGDKILQNAIAIDAAIIIVQQKLLKLLDCKSITGTSLEKQIKDIVRSLDPVYDFWTKRPEGSESEWKSRLLIAIYKMEDGIDIFRSKIPVEDQANAAQTIGISLPNMFVISWATCLLRNGVREFKSQITSFNQARQISEKHKPQVSESAKAKGPRRYDPKMWDELFSLDILGDGMAARKEDMKKLKERLLEKPNYYIVIVGEHGFGKTPLVRKIFTQLQGEFECCAWVDAFRTDTSHKAVHSILEQVSGKSSLMPNVQRPSMNLAVNLYHALSEKKYLIVLDDVGDWPLDQFVEVMNSVPYSAGSRLLITTQHKDIAYMLDPNPIVLKPLEEAEIKSLLSDKLIRAGGSLNEDTWKDKKEDFIKKCRGSQLKVDLLSGAIAKSPDFKIIKTIPDTDDLNRFFTYCYSDMCPQVKPCFLYMTLFPKSYGFPVRRLLRLWLSEGLLVVLQDANMEPEDLGMDHLKELVIRNFIEVVQWKEDGCPRRVRVVPVLYDLFCSGAIGTELLYIHPQKKTEGGDQAKDQHQQQRAAPRIRWLAEHSDIEGFSPDANKINGLRSFLSFNLREGVLTQAIGNFLKTVSGKGSNLLTVLDLEGVYKPNLDKVLGKLVLLKYLGLRSTALGSLPKSVADLPYLETLDLKHTNITELPKSFWKKSRNLRHLYLNTYCRIDKSTLSPSFATSKPPLTNLHTLSGAVVDSIRIDIHDQTQTLVGLSNMKKLTKLGIMFQFDKENQRAIGDWVSSLTDLQSLKLGIIKAIKPSELPSTLSLTQHHSLSKLYLLGQFKEPLKNLIPQNLITLTLSGSRMTNDHILQLGNFTNLKVLKLLADSFPGKILKLPSGLLRNLLVLKLWNLDELQKIELEGELPKIRTIELRKCHKMEEIGNLKNVVPDGQKKENGRDSTPVLLQLIRMTKCFCEKIKNQVSNEVQKKIIIKIEQPVSDPKAIDSRGQDGVKPAP